MNRFVYKNRSFSIYKSRLLKLLERRNNITIPTLYYKLLDMPLSNSLYYYKIVDLSDLDKIDRIQEILYNEFGSIYYDFSKKSWLDSDWMPIDFLPQYLISYYKSILYKLSPDESSELEDVIIYLSKLNKSKS